MKTEKPNRLVCEKSPYLLAHAYNPVEWYPWGVEAFDKAQRENKPVFLSIGYSTCHWCHVMEDESFENAEIAKLLNEYFVAIKVDREERSDIDSIYMSFVTATTGSGGWPLSVFLTPDQKPFYGGTYFPPEPRFGSPGFKSLLDSIHSNWIKQENKIRESADAVIASLRQRLSTEILPGQMLEPAILLKAYMQLNESFDAQNGGFGHCPKFPMGHNLSFLLRYWKNNGQPQALAIVEKTLRAMASGGIFDHLSGGFHRYATDAHWQVPHFEKMLYDQGLLTKIYLETFVVTGNRLYADTARKTLDYVLRDLCDIQGAFYTAEDADSLDLQSAEIGKKSEGAFYLWETKELEEILEPQQLRTLSYYFGIEKNGNALVDPHGEFIGKNILHVKHSLEQTAVYVNNSVENVVKIIDNAKEKLFTYRNQRPRPFLDDKILTDSNGLMISSFALASRVLNDRCYLDAAQKAAEFILTNLRREDGRLLHRYRDGQAHILAGLDDYAFFIAGLLDLYENSFDLKYFKEALRLNREMIDLFWDEVNGGFFLTAKDSQKLILRPKEVYDGAVPSGNSLAAHNLMRLYHFTFERSYLEKAETIFNLFYSQISAYPSAYTQMMMSLQFYFGPVKEIVVSGDIKNVNPEEMLEVIFKTWIAQRVLIVKTSEVKGEIEQLLPLSKNKNAAGKKLLIYVCENQTCQQPLDTPDALRKVLQ